MHSILRKISKSSIPIICCICLVSSTSGTFYISSFMTSATGINTSTDSNLATSEDEKKGPEYIIPVTPYFQYDPEWQSHLYGGVDSMAGYGCGPTALAVVIDALVDSESPIDPIELAIWSASNGHFSAGNGTVHSLIPEGAKAYGLNVEKTTLLNAEAFQMILSAGKILVLLMGPGDFTDGGHFIVVHGYASDGSLYIVDPASREHTEQTWDPNVIIDQLATHAYNGGPIWVISN